MFGVSYHVCFLLSGSHVASIFTEGAQTLWFAPLQPLMVYPWQVYVPSGDGLWLM